MAEPMVTRHGILNLQVCVPKEYTDKQAEEFANNANPTGVSSRWEIMPESEMEDLQRVQCEDHPENVHILLWC